MKKIKNVVEEQMNRDEVRKTVMFTTGMLLSFLLF